MKLITAAVMALVLFAGMAAAASIDGKWVSERKMERDGQTFTFVQTFDLKSEGSKVSGSIASVFGDREMSTQIQEGKIDGNKFSFSANYSTPNGDFKVVYEGAVEGDTLKGTVTRGEGPGRPFEAKRK